MNEWRNVSITTFYLFYKRAIEMEAKYHFTHLRSKDFNIFTNKTALDYLMKWSIKGQLKLATFCFNECFQSYQKQDLVEDFFKDAHVMNVINQMLPSWSYTKDMVEEIQMEVVPCTVSSMSFFDRLLDQANNIVRNGGYLHRCLDDIIDGFMVADELRKVFIKFTPVELNCAYVILNRNNPEHWLRKKIALNGKLISFKSWTMQPRGRGVDFLTSVQTDVNHPSVKFFGKRMLIDEESDNYGLFNEGERSEFIYKIFQFLVLGGKWCQYEDKITPYLDLTKILYKDLLRVEKNPETKVVEIKSLCLKIKLIGKRNMSIFPVDADHMQNFVYVIVDPTLRQLTLFAHEYGGQF